MNEKPLPLPTSLRVARTLLCIQLVLMALPLVIMLVDFKQQAIAGALLIPVLFEFIVGAAIGLVVAKMRSRRPWVRWTALAVEALLTVGQAWGVIADPSVAGLAGLALALGVISCLLSPTSTAWYKQMAPEGTTP
ncbi:hypothetical protein ACWEJ6_20715 [Nonomuraea sp. NPDC004702]